VQDDATNRMLAKEVLEGAGLEVHVVENGADAVQSVDGAHYDAILMDLNLPLMDGCEATRIIRRQPVYAELPIIAITASAAREDRARCFDAGMNDFVQTPIDSADLLAVLANWIRVPGVGTPETKPPSKQTAPLSFRSQSGSAADIPEIGSDWLDVRGTLRRLRGDASLYRRLMRRFLESHCTTAEKLRDREQAPNHLRSVHTLSSAAANIGALQLHRVAQTLELELRAGNASTNATWTRFESVFRQTLQLVATASGNSTSPPAGLADRDRLREELTKLATLLDEFDSAASDFVEKLPAVVGSGAISEEVYRIQRTVRAYDFEGAGQQVQALLMTLKPSALSETT
jgi:two-component system sensor histidine kinase/response regulator